MDIKRGTYTHASAKASVVIQRMMVKRSPERVLFFWGAKITIQQQKREAGRVERERERI
jgi:hypothetical protein